MVCTKNEKNNKQREEMEGETKKIKSINRKKAREGRVVKSGWRKGRQAVEEEGG